MRQTYNFELRRDLGHYDAENEKANWEIVPEEFGTEKRRSNSADRCGKKTDHNNHLALPPCIVALPLGVSDKGTQTVQDGSIDRRKRTDHFHPSVGDSDNVPAFCCAKMCVL